MVAFGAVKKGAAAEGMTLREYLWRGHDPTAVAVLMEVCVKQKLLPICAKNSHMQQEPDLIGIGYLSLQLNDGGLLEFHSNILLQIVV